MSAIISYGFGSEGSASLVITYGFGGGVVTPTPTPVPEKEVLHSWDFDADFVPRGKVKKPKKVTGRGGVVFGVPMVLGTGVVQQSRLGVAGVGAAAAGVIAAGKVTYGSRIQSAKAAVVGNGAVRQFADPEDEIILLGELLS